MDAGASSPGGVVVEVKRKAGSFAVVFRDHALEARMFAEAVAQQVGLGGLYRVRFPLIGGKSANKFQNQRDVGSCSRAD